MKRRHFLVASAVGLAAGSLPRLARADEPVRVGVIGHTGHGNYGHGLDTMWLKMPETRIVAVADADAKGLAAELDKLKIDKGYSDYRAMLAEAKPEIVAVAPRQIAEHHAMIMACIAAGVRGIYVEKPVCATLEQADEILAACNRHHVKLAIAHRNRYNPAINTVAKLVKEGLIGRLLEIRGRGKEDRRGGAQDLWVLGTHVMNLAFFFAGPPVAVSAVLMQDGRPATKADVREGEEDIGLIAGNEVHARFESASGVPLFFDSIQNAGEKAAGFGLQLIGTKGIIDLRMDETPIAHLLAGSPFVRTPRNADPRDWTPITTAGVGQPEPIADLKNLAGQHILGGRDLIAAVREDRQPLCSAADGQQLIEMIMGVFESHRQNGARIGFPLRSRSNPLASW